LEKRLVKTDIQIYRQPKNRTGNKDNNSKIKKKSALEQIFFINE
jgi:hypothetical protein